MKTYFNVNVRKKEDRLIHRAIEKHGEDNFSLIILEFCPFDTITLLEKEQLALDLWKPQYNVLTVAGAIIGFLHSEETSAAQRPMIQGAA